MFMPVSFFAVG